MTNTRTKIGVILAAVLMLFAGLAATNGTATAKQATTSDKCYEKVTQYKYVKYTHYVQRDKPKHGEWTEWYSITSWTPWGDGQQHLTWTTVNSPTLGSPEEHGDFKEWSDGQGQDKVDHQSKRVWQLHNTGDTRVVNGQEIPCPTLPPTTTEAPTTTTVVTTTTEAPTTTTEAPTTTQPDKKVLICHRDQGKPEWKVIEISENALDSHLNHQWGADIYPVPAEGCPVPPTEPPTTTEAPTTSTTTLPPTTTVPPTEPPATTEPPTSTEAPTTTVEPTTVAPTTVPPTTEPPVTRPSTVPPTVPVQPTFVWGSACGVFVGTAVNDSSANATYKFYADGALDKTVTVLPGQKYVYEKRFNEDTGVHTVQVDWPGDNMGTTVASDCKPPATTVAKAAPLPNTGSNTPALLLIGGALLALGIAATRFRRTKSA